MSTQAPDTSALSERELRAWRGLLRAHAAMVKRLDAELESVHGLALTSYEVLLHLHHAEGRKMRMCDVAESVLLSRSGLTRLVDRLERDGLVERVSCPDDARGAYARLTDAGRTKLEEASATHLAGVREHFLARVGDARLGVLGDAFDAIARSGGAASCDLSQT